MPTLVTDDGLIITRLVAATVEVKDALSDTEWTPVSHLYCDKLTLAVNAYDTAELSYELGEMIQPGTSAYADFQPLSILGKFVRVTCEQDDPLEDIVWIGVVISTAKQRSAVKDAGPANLLTGKTQVLTAVGLEYFLDRVQIDSAYVNSSPAEEEDPEDAVKIYRSIPFNGGRGALFDADTRTRANMAADVNSDGIRGFESAGNAGELWTLTDVLQYLTFYYTSVDTADNYLPVEFTLAAEDVLAGVTDGISPTLDPDGMTTFQVLNKLLAPQRGFVWWLEVEELSPGTPAARIRVETLATSAITLPSEGTIPANRDQQTLDFDQQRDVEDVIVAEAGSRIYHQVIARGARMTSTCTLGNIPTAEIFELVIDWDDAIVQFEYEEGAEDATAEESDGFRKSERFYRVYQAFRLSEDWDFKSSDGADAERDWTFPVLSSTGSVLDTLPVHLEGLRVDRLTRLKRGWDYEDASDPEETQPTDTEAEYMPMFAIVQVATGNELTPEDPGYPGTNPDKYQFIDKLNKSEFEGDHTAVSGNIHTTFDIGPQQNVPGVLLRAHGMSHAIALNHFEGDTASEPEVDYDTLRVTCTLEADAYCEAKWPADVDLPADKPLQKLLLHVGEEYRLDFLAANTVVDLENGEPVLTNGGVLRDDRDHLQDIARVAYEWYQLGRLPLTVRFKNTRNLFRLGMLITTIGTSTTLETINTVVSMIEYDFFKGTTMIKTNDQDLDLVRVS